MKNQTWKEIRGTVYVFLICFAFYAVTNRYK